MRVGVDYYPEHWDREMWDADARQMKAAGVSVVRLAEFAWSQSSAATMQRGLHSARVRGIQR